MKKEVNVVSKSLLVIVKMLLTIVKALMKLVYLIVKAFDNGIAKLFMKLPRLMKVGVIYTMVGLSILNFVDFPKVEKVNAETSLTSIAIEKVETTENTTNEVVEVKETSTTECKFSNEIACKIYNKGIEKGLTHEQAVLIVAISKHETGTWTSKAFNNNNNFGGIMCNSGLKNYETFEDGLNDFVRILKSYYFDLGLTTIEQIGAKYCPVGAKNDPKGLNKNWVPGVTSIYQSLLESVK